MPVWGTWGGGAPRPPGFAEALSHLVPRVPGRWGPAQGLPCWPGLGLGSQGGPALGRPQVAEPEGASGAAGQGALMGWVAIPGSSETHYLGDRVGGFGENRVSGKTVLTTPRPHLPSALPQFIEHLLHTRPRAKCFQGRSALIPRPPIKDGDPRCSLRPWRLGRPEDRRTDRGRRLPLPGPAGCVASPPPPKHVSFKKPED